MMARALLVLVLVLPGLAAARDPNDCEQNGVCTLQRLTVGTLRNRGAATYSGPWSTSLQAITISDTSDSGASLTVGDGSASASTFAPTIKGTASTASTEGLTLIGKVGADNGSSTGVYITAQSPSGASPASASLFSVGNTTNRYLTLGPTGNLQFGAASSNYAITFLTAGARLRFSASGNDYLTGDGATIVQAASNFLAGNNLYTGGGNILTSGGGKTLALRASATDGASAVAVKSANQSGLSTRGAAIHGFYSDDLSTLKASVTVEGGVRLNIAGGAAPTCDATTRGDIHVTRSAAGVTDSFEVCLKSAADTYSWRSIITGG